MLLRHLAGQIRKRYQTGHEPGQTLAEYALLLALIAMVVIAALIVLGPIVSMFFQDFGDTVTDVT